MKKKNINKFILNKFMQYGLHLGGIKRFSNPKSRAYIIGFRHNFGILDLTLTHRNMRHLLKLLLKVVFSKRKILFVGAPVGLEKNFSLLCKKYGHYCFDILPNGFFTNFGNSSLRSFQERPALILFFDVSNHQKVRKEILMVNIPVLAFVTTNDDVEGVDYPIPASLSNWKGGLFIYNLIYSVLSLPDQFSVKK